MQAHQQALSGGTAGSEQKILPNIALAGGVLILGMSAILVKWANAPGAVSGLYRMGIATAVLALPFGSHIQRRGSPSIRHVLFAILGGIFFALDLTAWNTAILITSAANATLLGSTSPLWVGIGTLVLFRRRLKPSFWGGTLLAMAGAAYIMSRDFTIHAALGKGDMLGLTAGFFYGLFFLAAERAREKLSSLAALWISVATSTAVLLLLSLALGQPLTGYPPQTYISLIVLALTVQVAGWYVLNFALGHLPAALVSTTLLGQPVLTAILAIPLLGQQISAPQIIGGLVVLTGILIVHRNR